MFTSSQIAVVVILTTERFDHSWFHLPSQTLANTLASVSDNAVKATPVTSPYLDYLKKCVSLLSHVSLWHYRQTSNIRRAKSQNLNVSRIVLQLSLPNLLKADVK